MSVAGLGDIDGDGIPDFLMGEPWAEAGGVSGIGAVTVVSGATGSTIYRVLGDDGYTANFGYSCDSAGDVDGDGVDDFVVGAPIELSPMAINTGGSFAIYSGATGALLSRQYGEGSEYKLGWSVASAGDVDGDGDSEVVIGAPGADISFTNAGAAYIYDFKPFLNTDTYTVSAASGGAVGLELAFPDAAMAFEYKILISASGIGPSHYGVDIPLTQDSMAIDSFYGIYPFSTYSGLHGTLSATGDASASIIMSPGLPAGLVGRTFWLAAIANPAGQLPKYSSVAVPIEITP